METRVRRWGNSLAIRIPKSQIKGYLFEVVLPPGLAVSGAILADQVKSLDWRARSAEFTIDDGE